MRASKLADAHADADAATYSPRNADAMADGDKFLAENKLKDGVITLPSGLQYKVLEEGAGLEHPLVSTPCACHYAGRLIDGTEFDSSYKRGTPTTFAPNQVIKVSRAKAHQPPLCEAASECMQRRGSDTVLTVWCITLEGEFESLERARW